jgi:hypothetical protein
MASLATVRIADSRILMKNKFLRDNKKATGIIE